MELTSLSEADVSIQTSFTPVITQITAVVYISYLLAHKRLSVDHFTSGTAGTSRHSGRRYIPKPSSPGRLKQMLLIIR